MSWIFSALVCRFIPNLSLHHYEDIDTNYSFHFPPSPIMVNHLFSNQKGILPFLFVWASSKEIFLSGSRSCNINVPTLCHSLSSLLSHAFYFPAPLQLLHLSKSQDFNLHKIGWKGLLSAQLQERPKTDRFFSSQKLRCQIQMITRECHKNFLANASWG